MGRWCCVGAPLRRCHGCNEASPELRQAVGAALEHRAPVSRLQWSMAGGALEHRVPVSRLQWSMAGAATGAGAAMEHRRAGVGAVVEHRRAPPTRGCASCLLAGWRYCCCFAATQRVLTRSNGCEGRIRRTATRLISSRLIRSRRHSYLVGISFFSIDETGHVVFLPGQFCPQFPPQKKIVLSLFFARKLLPVAFGILPSSRARSHPYSASS